MKKIFLFMLFVTVYFINLDVCFANPHNNKTSVSIGKSYSDGSSSIAHAQEAYTSYYNMGLTSKLITNPTISNLNLSHSNGRKYLESGIVYFSGHAGTGNMNYNDVLVYMFSGSGNSYISMIDFNNSYSALVTFGGCDTAGDGDDNITYATYASGATTTMGWTTALNINSYENWNKRFHDKIETKTTSVLAAAQHASSYIYLVNNVKNYKIYGDSSRNPWYHMTNAVIASVSNKSKIYSNEKISKNRSNNFLTTQIENVNLDNYKLEINGVHETYYDYVLYVDDVRTNYGYTIVENNSTNEFSLKNNMGNYTYEYIKKKIFEKQIKEEKLQIAKDSILNKISIEKNINKYEISNEMKYYNVDEDKLYYVVEVKNMYNDKNYDLVSYMEEI